MSRKTLAWLGTSALLGLIIIGCSSNAPFLQSPNTLSGSDPIIDVTNPSKETHTQYVARLHTELSAGYYARKQYQVALEEVDAAIKTDAQYAPAYDMMALIHSTLGDNTGAEKAFRRALQYSPNDPDIRNNFGAFLCERRRFKESLEQFEYALRNPLYQTPKVALRNAAECAFKGGYKAKAVELYTELGEPIPDSLEEKSTTRVTTPTPSTAATNAEEPANAKSLVQSQAIAQPQPMAAIPSQNKPVHESELDIARAAYDHGDLIAAEEAIRRTLNSGEATPATLHLAMCIERRFANTDEEEHYANMLTNQFASSPEARSLNTTERGCS